MRTTHWIQTLLLITLLSAGGASRSAAQDPPPPDPCMIAAEISIDDPGHGTRLRNQGICWVKTHIDTSADWCVLDATVKLIDEDTGEMLGAEEAHAVGPARYVDVCPIQLETVRWCFKKNLRFYAVTDSMEVQLYDDQQNCPNECGPIHPSASSDTVSVEVCNTPQECCGLRCLGMNPLVSLPSGWAGSGGGCASCQAGRTVCCEGQVGGPGVTALGGEGVNPVGMDVRYVKGIRSNEDWLFSYDYRLKYTQLPSGKEHVYINRGDAVSGDYVHRVGAGAWDADLQTERTRLEKQVNGGATKWIVTLPDQTKEEYNFDPLTSKGKLAKVTDPHGNATDLSFDTNNNLTKVTSPAGIASTLTWSNNRLTSYTDGASRTYHFDYDGGGALTKITQPDGTAWTYAYDGVGNLSSETDGHGHVTTYYYDSSKRLTQVTNPLGHSASFSYGSDGNLTKTVDAEGHETQYFYSDNTGELTKAQDALGNATTYAYGAYHRLETVTDARGNQTLYNYNASGDLYIYTEDMGGSGQASWYLYYDNDHRLTQVKDPLGRTETYLYDTTKNTITKVIQKDSGGTELANSTYEYNTLGQVTKVTDPRGKVWSGFYDSKGNLTRVTDPLGGHTDLSWTSAGDPDTFTNPLGHKTKFYYDTERRPTKVTFKYHLSSAQQEDLKFYYDCCSLLSQEDELGNVTRYFYDAAHRLTNVLDAEGDETKAQYDKVGNVTKLTDANSNATTFAYDALRRLTQTTYPVGSYTDVLAYDAGGNLTKHTDPRGNATTFLYDGRDRLTKATLANGGAVTLEFDKVSNLTKLTDPLSHATKGYYDALNRLTQVTDANNGAWKLFYDANGNLTRFEDARSKATDLQYDDLNRLTKVIDPNNHATTLAYDAADRLTRVTNALSQNVDFFYDDNGWLTRLSAPLNRSADFFYDKAGQVTKFTDALNRETAFAYDKTYLLTQVTDALNNTVKGSFDPVGNLTKLTNEKSNSWTVLYDALNRTTKVTHPDSATETYAYDGNDNLTAYTDGNNNTTNYSYDSVDLLTKKDFPAGMTDVEYSYDTWGNPTKRVDATGTTTYLYDALDRLTKMTDPNSKVVTSSFDAVGNRTKLTDPDSGDTTYLYDNANRLTSLTNADNQTTTFLYDALDRVTKQTHHNGTYATYAFNAAGDLTQLEHRASGGGLLSTFSYLYNNVGNLTQASETVGGNSATTTYLYDALDRLTQEKRTTSNAYWYEYLYDAAGNRTKFVQKDTSGNQTGSKGYAYDAANKLTLEGDLSAPGANGNIQYTFDSNGNLTKKQIVGDGSTTYLYDFENHLTKLNDGVTLTFTYDGDGVRKSLTNGSLTTRFIHDFDGLTVLAETDGNGNTTATYTHGLGLISQRRGSTTSYYHADLLGTTRQMTNSSQTVTDSYVFDAWGNALSSTGSTANPYRFAGQWGYYDDGASGLMLLGARYYDAGVGRFITQDPIGDGLNWYGYVDNNPVNLIDPEGLSIWDWRIWPWNWFGGGDKRWQQQMERDRSWSEWLFDKLGWNPPQPQNPDPTSGGHAFGVYAANQTGLRVTQQNTQTVAPHLIPGGTFGIGGPAQFAGVRPSPSAQPALPPAPQIRTRPALPPVPVRPALPPAPLTQAQKNALWRAAPGIYRQHFGRIPTDELGRAFQIHHRIPLEWAHLFPRLNPNNIDNLMALPPAVHERVNAIWTWFRNALGGQRPTQQQVLNVVRSIDCVIDDLLY